MLNGTKILGSTQCQDIWPLNECISRKQKNNCKSQPIRTYCPATCGLCGGSEVVSKPRVEVTSGTILNCIYILVLDLINHIFVQKH